MSITKPTIVPASIQWQTDDFGNTIPFSTTFNDVYYSVANGLTESRYIFIEHNFLPQRFKALFDTPLTYDNATFTIAELGFGTGLNLLTTWALWLEVKAEWLSIQAPSPSQKPTSISPRLHFISTEKHPLTLADLACSLEVWRHNTPKLAPLIDTLSSHYPTLVAGCHRLYLAEDVILDLWLGDAMASLSHLRSANANETRNSAVVDAWYLDGFAPSRNEALWATQIFNIMYLLSKPNTTVATFSCAGIVKRGLTQAGFTIKKAKGFGQKRQMLTASIVPNNVTPNLEIGQSSETNATERERPESGALHEVMTEQVAVIGAGISGLMSAWSLAQRGIRVLLMDKLAPLAGASGNPRALLAPKMTPLPHVSEHLHSISYLYSQRFYKHLNNSMATSNKGTINKSVIFEPTGTLDLLIKANINTAQIADYPSDMATTLSECDATTWVQTNKQDLSENLYLPQAGLINPQALAHTILEHPLITFITRDIQRIEVEPQDSKTSPQISSQSSCKVTLVCNDNTCLHTDKVVIATAHHSHQLDNRIFDFRKIRGQLSWFVATEQQIAKLPKLPLKYGGYCALFVPNTNDKALNTVTPKQPTFLLGASFIRNDLTTNVRDSEHQSNRAKLVSTLPELATLLPENTSDWQARVGIRAQTPDYHPVVGKIDDKGFIWALGGMGSKGYAFAPLCAEILADMITHQFTPLPTTLLKRLSPHRQRLQTPLN